MEFTRICEVFEQIAATRSTNKKVSILANFLEVVPHAEIPLVVRAFTGVLVPKNQQAPKNIAYKSLWDIALSILRVSPETLEKRRQKHGDLGAAVASLFRTETRARQTRLFEAQKPTSLQEVAELYRSLEFTGEGSYTKKKQRVKVFLDRLSPLEAKYFIRLFFMWLNIGLQAGLIVRAISKLAGVSEDLVRLAVMKFPDLGEIALLTITGGEKALKAVRIKPLIPVLPMLAMPAESLKSALRDYAGILAAEYKYDGIRLQVHHVGPDNMEIFSRRLSTLTPQFPDLVEGWKEACNLPSGKSVVVEGEIVGFAEGKITPFQVFMKRIRQHDIHQVAREVPIKFFVFDILFFRDRDVTELSYGERYALLEQLVQPNDLVQLATRVVTNDLNVLRDFYEQALDAGCEGVMLKDLRASYAPGTRGTRMMKYKSTLETLDLPLVGAEYGEGKKSAIFSRFFFAALDESHQSLTRVAKVSTGLTDEQYNEVNELITPLITQEKGRRVEITPKLVFEILADEILESPRFEKGYSLRFARMVRLREDLGVDDIDDIAKIRELYQTQRSRKNEKGKGNIEE